MPLWAPFLNCISDIIVCVTCHTIKCWCSRLRHVMSCDVLDWGSSWASSCSCQVPPRHTRSDIIITDTYNDTSLHSFHFFPSSFSPSTDGSIPTSTSFRKIVAFARPERRPLLTAIGLLLVSSSVSLSIPFTVGKFINHFTSANPVSHLLDARHRLGSHRFYPPKGDPVWFFWWLKPLLSFFTIGDVCNAGRAFLMHMSGASRWRFPEAFISSGSQVSE